MVKMYSLILKLFLLSFSCLVRSAHYTNVWTVLIKGSRKDAEEIAQEKGFVIELELSGRGHRSYFFRRPGYPEINENFDENLDLELVRIPEVIDVEQQIATIFHVMETANGTSLNTHIYSKISKFETYVNSGCPENQIDDRKLFPPAAEDALPRENDEPLWKSFAKKVFTWPITPKESTKQQRCSCREKHCPEEMICARISPSKKALSSYKKRIEDPFFPVQWHMHDCRKSTIEPRYDINVEKVWKQNNFGQGIKVMIIDDGLETNHPDLYANYDSKYGFNVVTNIGSPDPDDREESHGTRNAGIIAMQRNNNICGVGIAPLITLGAVKVGSNGNVLPYDNIARAVTFQQAEIDIALHSWGGGDDGTELVHPSRLLRGAFATAGRGGRGVIHVFPSGSGRANGDMCGCNFFLNFIRTIVVASADYEGKVQYFSERCAAVLVTGYTGSGSNMYNIATTTTNGGCTLRHAGASAAAAMVAGIIALVLKANPNLIWREIQHLIVKTSSLDPLLHSRQDNWIRNGAGFRYSHNFGFGLINAKRLVNEAKSFKSVPEMSTCVVTVVPGGNDQGGEGLPINATDVRKLDFNTDACRKRSHEINFLEHVLVTVTITYSRRGDLQMSLTSPKGTVANLLEPRINDDSTEGFQRFSFDSVATWGENPRGKWSLRIFDVTRKSTNKGMIQEIVMVLHGTMNKPAHYNQRSL